MLDGMEKVWHIWRADATTIAPAIMKGLPMRTMLWRSLEEATRDALKAERVSLDAAREEVERLKRKLADEQAANERRLAEADDCSALEKGLRAEREAARQERDAALRRAVLQEARDLRAQLNTAWSDLAKAQLDIEDLLSK